MLYTKNTGQILSNLGSIPFPPSNFLLDLGQIAQRSSTDSFILRIKMLTSVVSFYSK